MMIKKEKELKKMEYCMHVTAAAHYISSDFYSEWNIKLQYVSYIPLTYLLLTEFEVRTEIRVRGPYCKLRFALGL